MVFFSAFLIFNFDSFFCMFVIESFFGFQVVLDIPKMVTQNCIRSSSENIMLLRPFHPHVQYPSSQPHRTRSGNPSRTCLTVRDLVPLRHPLTLYTTLTFRTPFYFCTGASNEPLPHFVGGYDVFNIHPDIYAGTIFHADAHAAFVRLFFFFSFSSCLN